MSNKLYIGNLSFETTETELRDLFAQAGPVQEAIVIQDRVTGRSRGFGFVTMMSPEEANAALDQLNGQNLNGRPLSISIARPLESRSGGAGGGGGGSRFGGKSFGGGGGGGGGGSRGGRDRDSYGDRRRSEARY